MGISCFDYFEYVQGTGEKILNIAGYIPFIVSPYSGMLRGMIGIVQVVAGLFFGFVAACISFCCIDAIKKQAFMSASDRAFQQSVHGLANVVRSVVEMFSCGIFLWCCYDRDNTRLVYRGEEKVATAAPQGFQANAGVG